MIKKSILAILICYLNLVCYAQSNITISSVTSVYFFDCLAPINKPLATIPSFTYSLNRNKFGIEVYFNHTFSEYVKDVRNGIMPNTMLYRDLLIGGLSVQKKIYKQKVFVISSGIGVSAKQSNSLKYIKETIYPNHPELVEKRDRFAFGLAINTNLKYFISKRYYLSSVFRFSEIFICTTGDKSILLNETGIGIQF